MKKSQLRNIIKTVIKEQLTNPGFVCQDGNCLDCSNPMYSTQYCLNTQANTFPTLNQCLNSGCSGDLCKQCQQQAWPGFTSWFSTFMNQPHFNSPNPNQPCNMLCNKIQVWQNRCSNTTGPQHKNKLGCKIKLAKQLIGPSHHNCNC